jgi:hypothetical protein
MLTALERAMPGPLEASFEVQVAEYLRQLFGSRTTERRTALRVAQERVDQQRAESSSQISVGSLGSLGTLRAIAIDRMDGSSQSQTPGRISTPLLVRNTPTPTPTPLPNGRSKQAFVALAGALAVVTGALMLKMPATAGSTPKVGSGGMVPVETIMPAPPKAVLPPPASAPQSAPSALASSEPEPSSETTKKSGHERKAPLRSGRPVVGNAAAVSTPATAPPAATPTPAAVTAAPASAPAATASGSALSTNAFGRGAFGGRH